MIFYSICVFQKKSYTSTNNCIFQVRYQIEIQHQHPTKTKRAREREKKRDDHERNENIPRLDELKCQMEKCLRLEKYKLNFHYRSFCCLSVVVVVVVVRSNNKSKCIGTTQIVLNQLSAHASTRHNNTEFHFVCFAFEKSPCLILLKKCLLCAREPKSKYKAS